MSYTLSYLTIIFNFRVIERKVHFLILWSILAFDGKAPSPTHPSLSDLHTENLVQAQSGADRHVVDLECQNS